MAFKALQIRYIRFLGPEKDPAEFTFTPGLNILWGSSDTGKTFLVQAMDFMLGAGSKLKDIPEAASATTAMCTKRNTRSSKLRTRKHPTRWLAFRTVLRLPRMCLIGMPRFGAT
jgi:hypothetical protein